MKHPSWGDQTKFKLLIVSFIFLLYLFLEYIPEHLQPYYIASAIALVVFSIWWWRVHLPKRRRTEKSQVDLQNAQVDATESDENTGDISIPGAVSLIFFAGLVLLGGVRVFLQGFDKGSAAIMISGTLLIAFGAFLSVAVWRMARSYWESWTQLDEKSKSMQDE